MAIRELVGDVRDEMIEQALARSGGNVSEAARLLKVSRQAVQQVLRSRRDAPGEASGEALEPHSDGPERPDVH